MADTAITLGADLAEIARMNLWLEANHGASEEVFERMKLCLNEAVENTIRYGFEAGQGGEVEVRLGQTGGCAEIEIIDNGRAFDPLERAAPEAMTDLETASIGGFGILLMREAASSLEYERRGDRNILIARFCERGV
jgi:anti-sigma regulatory factor (Ser/Thr protein kinase)